MGLLRTMKIDGGMGSAAVIVVPILAMIGALAVACFVKVYGAVFLGTARTGAATHAHESPSTMWGPMIVLAACCAFIGMAPALLTSILDSTIASWSPQSASTLVSVGTLVPLGAVSVMSGALAAIIIVLAISMTIRSRVATRVGTWDCGYASPTSRIQYTASSFAQMIVRMFRWVLWPRVHRANIEGLFPKPTKMHSHVDDMVLDRILLPITHRIERWSGWFRRFQQGMTQQYVLYILATVLVLLGMLIPFKEFITRLFAR